MMVGLASVVALFVAQPVVRQLDVAGPITREGQVIAANEGFIWFTAGDASQWLRGGDRVFRFTRASGLVEPAIAGNDWSGTDLFDHEVPGAALRVGGHPRGDALFTLDGEFRTGGRFVMQYEFPRQVSASAGLVVWFSEEGSFISTAPGQVQPLDVATRVTLPHSTSDGRISWLGRRDGGPTVTVTVFADGGIVERRDALVSGHVGETWLFSRADAGLFNEAGERLGPAASRIERAPAGIGATVFWVSGEGSYVTNGTPGGTRRLSPELLPTQWTETFATFLPRDGGMFVERFSDGAQVALPEVMFGSALDDRLINRNVELFADGGLVRRADVTACDWSRLDPRSRELLCFHDGALLARATPDAPQRELLGGFARGRGTGLMRNLERPLVEGAPMLLRFPFPMWTDGVAARAFSIETVVGQHRNQVVFPDDGVTLLNVGTGERRALGLSVSWQPQASLRELFVQQPSCELRRVGARDEFLPIAPLCLRELVDVPGGLLARSADLTWFRFAPEQQRFVPIGVRGFLPLSSVVGGVGDFASSSLQGDSESGLFREVSTHELVDLATGEVLETFGEGETVVLSPLGTLSTRAQRQLDGDGGWTSSQPLTFKTREGLVFPVDDAPPPLQFSWTSKAVWLVSATNVQVSTGGPFHVVTSDVERWRPSAAVGTSLFIRNETELVSIDPAGTITRFPFVEARQSFSAGDTRWFSLDDGVHGFEPWRFDGASLELMADLVPGPESSHPHFLGLARGRVVLEAGRPEGTIGLTSIEFQPVPEDPSVPFPEAKSGCAGCSSTSMVQAVVVLLVLHRRRSRRCRGSAMVGR